LILEWVNHVDLFRIKGVGEEYSDWICFLAGGSGVCAAYPGHLPRRLVVVRSGCGLHLDGRPRTGGGPSSYWTPACRWPRQADVGKRNGSLSQCQRIRPDRLSLRTGLCFLVQHRVPITVCSPGVIYQPTMTFAGLNPRTNPRVCNLATGVENTCYTAQHNGRLGPSDRRAFLLR